MIRPIHKRGGYVIDIMIGKPKKLSLPEFTKIQGFHGSKIRLNKLHCLRRHNKELIDRIDYMAICKDNITEETFFFIGSFRFHNGVLCFGLLLLTGLFCPVIRLLSNTDFDDLPRGKSQAILVRSQWVRLRLQSGRNPTFHSGIEQCRHDCPNQISWEKTPTR